MRKRIFALIGAFIISINFIGSASITAYASEHGGGGVSRPADKTSLNMFHEWSLVDKAMYFRDNLLSIIGGAVGIIFNPMNWEYSYISDQMQQLAYDCHLITESEDYWDWVANCLSVNDEGELVVNDELSDLIYQVTNVYIEEKCGWYEWNTYIPSDLIKYFNNKCQYDYLVELCKNLSANEVVLCRPYVYDYGVDSSGAQNLQYSLFSVCAYDGMVDCRYSKPYCGALLCLNWEYIPERSLLSMHPSGIENGFSQNLTTQNSGFLYESGTADGSSSWFIVTNNRQVHRVFKTFEDYKMYSVGERPYYVTDKFQDYDINGDNSCILSESDLSNGSVYGDVYNYIINNYDNPDGLTEDELRDILDDYFNNSGGGSGSSGNGSGSGSSGNGLLDFLGGLGSIGDAILSILGKLMEYIGKALDLVGGTVTKVIDIIPKNITALLGALFPFFPEEWLTAIELGLVLAVIVGIVGLFKK